ncbi:OLC1v1028741C1 [Oldenlandia corymbosa var. corymbosa]|uniref:OLC1v1028741C1 n=1 Tax=Oldenlandia corymbosa var. corymbosa TaxID=529605 RepID=A0AAV1CD81_OLDCO|nr:OLC1v1028741C1 [Oldenlandia corymbosa var. corymbosa]
MSSDQGKREQRSGRLVALTGGAAAVFLALAVNFAVSAINSRSRNRKKREVRGSNVQINLTASEILRLADRIIAQSKKVYDSVAAIPLDKVTCANVLLPLAELEGQHFPLVQSCVFPKLVSTSEDVRKACAEAERRIDSHVSTCSKREDIYRVVKALVARGDYMSSEEKCFAKILVQDFERNGLNLPMTKREELQRLKTQIDELSMQYIRNLNDDQSYLLFTEIELAGLPPEFLKVLDEDGKGKYKISLKSHHVSPTLELCKVGSTRKAVAVAYGRRCEANIPILEKMIQSRHRLARLLGYGNYADYAINHRMAGSSSKVFDLLEDISGNLSEQAARELAILRELKKQEEGELTFGVEDLLYYVKRARDQQIDLDFGDVKQYFPVNLVLSGIFKICQDLFGLRFEIIEDAEVWHSDVELFSVFDLSSGDLMGYFYLDIYSREGKYAHTCVVALQNGSLIGGRKLIPIALLISQFEKEVDGHPGLLRFPEVVNLLHEFGHVVQYICNRASIARFSGLRLDPDFVEIPARMLENWCYESLSLKLISGFHKDITKAIDDNICESLKRWRSSFSALRLKQEILYCLFDQIIHSTEDVDIQGLYKHLHPKVLLGLPALEGTNPASSFPGSAIGFEATCYSRIWSEVFAADIFASKFSVDLFNQHTGMQFRNKVFAPGGEKDPLQLLSDFLGKEPSIQAFLDAKSDSC